jgi:hypothetical protein
MTDHKEIIMAEKKIKFDNRGYLPNFNAFVRSLKGSCLPYFDILVNTYIPNELILRYQKNCYGTFEFVFFLEWADGFKQTKKIRVNNLKKSK